MEDQIPPQNIETEQQPAQVPPIAPENSNRSFWKTIGIGMGIVSFCTAIAFIGYFLVSGRNKATISNQQISTVQETATPTPTIDPTANWKTYISPNFGYSIKYPIDITPALQQDSRTYQGIGGSVNVDEWSLLGQPSYGVQIFSYKEGVNSKLEFNLQSQPITTIQLANQTVNKTVSIDETLVQVGPIEHLGNAYMIIYGSGTSKNNIGLALFNQILSTFKFTQ